MSTHDTLGFYSLLGADHNASQAEIKAAYRTKAMEFHPDRNPHRDTTSDFQSLQEAYDVLSNEKLRQQYDANSSIPVSEDSSNQEVINPLNPFSALNVMQFQHNLDIKFSIAFMVTSLAHLKNHTMAFFALNVKLKKV